MRIRTKKTLLRVATAAVVASTAALLFLPAAAASAQPAQFYRVMFAPPPVIPSFTAR